MASPPELPPLLTDNNDPADPTTAHANALSLLRQLQPQRLLSLDESISVTERQAARLLHLRGVRHAPVPDEIITGLFRVDVRYAHDLPLAGYAHWLDTADSWLIHINARDHRFEQRLTIAHEFKHIIEYLDRHDDPQPHHRGHHPAAPQQQAEEWIAEYFAHCLLMPKSLVVQYFTRGVQEPAALARIFAVPEYALRERLTELGLARRSTIGNRRGLWERFTTRL